MRPDDESAEGLPGQDSFLDIVANIVGILIILVVVVGAGASRAVVEAVRQSSDGPDATELSARLDEAKHQMIQRAARLQEVRKKVHLVAREADAFDQKRIELNIHKQLMEEDLQARRDALSTKQQSEYDVQREILQLNLKLDELDRERLRLASMETEVETIESAPTPMAKKIDGPAIHLRLRNGLVSVVPFEELAAEVEFATERLGRQLRSRDEAVEVFGPIDGYRMRLRLTRTGGRVTGPMAGASVRRQLVQHATFLPASPEMGAAVEQALLPGGPLAVHLREHRRGTRAVVAWVYEDSLSELRLVKNYLWDEGFSLAVRLLGPQDHIAAGTFGTASAAQ
ncbi:MAG: hypothetical protein AAGA92_03350 [Planctomycetota bacterium]